jgi:hypothetical protein
MVSTTGSAAGGASVDDGASVDAAAGGSVGAAVGVGAAQPAKAEAIKANTSSTGKSLFIFKSFFHSLLIQTASFAFPEYPVTSFVEIVSVSQFELLCIQFYEVL